jgi:tRNA threonylcarbamoyladenosine biosynthesis protein TsaB
MRVLGIDTATRRVGVVLASSDGILGRIELDGPIDGKAPRHAEALAPAIATLCERAGVGFEQLSAVAVGVGPGMFTGLRVGVTTAKVLAQALRIPAIPIPSLDLLAFPLRHAHALIVPTIDARRHELYYALYRPVPGGVQRISDYEIGTPEDLACELEARGEETILCGDGMLRFLSTFSDLDRVEYAGVAHTAPSLSALAELAVGRYQREEFCAPADVLPLYLRKSDAEISFDVRSA